MFSVVQLSRATQFHQLNFSYMANSAALQKELDNLPGGTVNTDLIINALENIKALSVNYLFMTNRFDRIVMKLINADKAISLSRNNIKLAERLLEQLHGYSATYVTEPTLIESLNNSINTFSHTSKKLEESVDRIGALTIEITLWFTIPFSFFICFFSLFIFKKIKIKTKQLHNAIIALEESEEEKRILAYYDSLTSLANRNMFIQILEHELKQVDRYNNSFALFFIDLDRFKSVNDTLGHDAGDDLLVQVSQRLKSCTRESDTLARFGGDEFLIILSGKDSDKHVDIIAEKILAALSQPFLLGKGQDEVSISASIGVAHCPTHGVDSTSLLKKADIAMYKAKTNGKNQFSCYDEVRIDTNTIVSNVTPIAIEG